MPRLKILAY
ncbi:hypothetical protein AB3S75_000457 [Citrus x aurantiifolia]